MALKHKIIPKYRWLVALLFVGVLFTIVSPFASLDAVILIAASIAVGHTFLQEKLFFVFLIIRPILDLWTDIAIIQTEQFSLNLNALISLGFSAWALYLLYTKYKKELPYLPAVFLGLSLTILMIISAAYSVAPLASLEEGLKFLSYLACFALAYIGIKKKHYTLRDFAKVTVALSVVPLLFGIWQFVTRTGITTFDITNRIFGTFAHPNVFAFFLLFLIVLYAYWQEQTDQNTAKNTKLHLLVYVGLSFLLLQTFTRAAWIGLAVFLIVIGILRYRKIFVTTVVGIVGFYLLFFPVNAVIQSVSGYNLQNIQIIARLTSTNEDANSLEWRQQLFLNTIPLVRSEPILGYGYGSFPTVWDRTRDIQSAYDDSDESHNDYLRMVIELGLVGLVLYLLFFFVLFIEAAARYARQKDRAAMLYLFTWVIVFGVVSLSDNMLHHAPVMWLMWTWWGVLFAGKWKHVKGLNLLGVK